MANLAIKGHTTRGSEVIALLEMLGGKIRRDKLGGNELFSWYYINGNGYIDYKHYSLFDGTKVFTLEEFLEKFPYKVGDKVMTDDGDKANIVGMIWDNDIDDVFYETRICNEVFKYPKELLQPYKEETMEIITIEDLKANTKEWLIDKLGNMSTKDALQTISNIYNELHKPQYPKTYKECCDVLGLNTMDNDAQGYEADLIICFQELLIARNAYWKIAGEQMGLGKPWEPNWKNSEERRYSIVNIEGDINLPETTLTKWILKVTNKILVFPTSEMRDAFYENFKKLIEICKKLL